jgi:hypothetical protein
MSPENDSHRPLRDLGIPSSNILVSARAWQPFATNSHISEDFGQMDISPTAHLIGKQLRKALAGRRVTQRCFHTRESLVLIVLPIGVIRILYNNFD